jgi:2-amino-4-hydroxy-6-hydroxymethyldihydropteridine diphosphokinase
LGAEVDPTVAVMHYFSSDEREMTTAYLGLGANLGDRLAALRGARQALASLPGIRVEAVSALYETVPIGGPPGQGAYLNAVLQVSTDLPAEKLLYHCLAIEGQFGRERLVHHGPRTLDIDLLFFADLVCQKRDLTLPHPRLHLRAFVLAPLCDLAPRLSHPLLGKTVSELRAQLPDDQGVKRLPVSW